MNMGYEVTATRRRPQRFEDLVGQEFVAATLKNSIQSGQIAHAYLFSGPRGCGKTSTARILAKALNCQSGEKATATPCCTCTACTEITKGSSMDVIEIDGASNTSVNDVRQIKDEVQFPPNSCRYKIYIIDEVHMLSTSAFNALLKTIEEPPPYVIFIFATTELQKVPATIKSRCQQFNFRLVPVEQVKNLLAEASKEIGIEAEDEALYWIARESTGSIRDAYTLFDQVAAFSDGHISYEKIRDKLGLVGVDRLNEIFELCVAANSEGVINKLDEYLQSGISIEQLISNSADYLRSLLLLKNGVKKEALLGQAPERYSVTVLDSWNSIQIERALSLFLQLYRDIRYSLSPRYEIELSFSRLCWLKEYVSPAEVNKAIEAAKSLLLAEHPEAMQAQGNRMPASSMPRQEVSSSTSQPVQEQSHPLPAGMPRFSALMNAQEVQQKEVPASTFAQSASAQQVQHSSLAPQSYAPPASSSVSQSNSYNDDGDYPPMDDAPDIPPDEESGPFYDGGALPPKESEAVSLSSEESKNRVVEELTSNDDGFVASAIMQAVSWTLSDRTVTIVVDTDFKKIQLERQKETVLQALNKVCSKQMQLIVTIKTDEAENGQNVEIPQEVENLCKMFRGTIVGGKV